MCIHNPLFFYCFLLLQQSDISCSLAPPCLNHLIHPAFLMRAKVRNIALVSSLFNPRYFTLRYLHLSTFFLPLALFHLSRTHAYCLGKFHTLRQPHTQRQETDARPDPSTEFTRLRRKREREFASMRRMWIVVVWSTETTKTNDDNTIIKTKRAREKNEIDASERRSS